MEKNKIVVIGSSNVDLIMKMDHLPETGETVTDAEFMQVYGGKGANQAVAAARAGGNVSFINCVGEDAYTPEMVRNYEKDGINTDYVFHEKGIASGHALIMLWLTHRVASLHGRALAPTTFKAIGASVAMGLVLFGIMPWLGSWLSAGSLPAELFLVGLAMLVGGGVYLGTLWFLRTPELELLAGLLQRLLRRPNV